MNPTRYVSYSARPLKGILVAQNVYSSFWSARAGSGFRCQTIPELRLAALGKDTGYRCQYRTPESSITPPRWQPVSVWLDAKGELEFRG